MVVDARFAMLVDENPLMKFSVRLLEMYRKTPGDDAHLQAPGPQVSGELENLRNNNWSQFQAFMTKIWVFQSRYIFV